MKNLTIDLVAGWDSDTFYRATIPWSLSCGGTKLQRLHCDHREKLDHCNPFANICYLFSEEVLRIHLISSKWWKINQTRKIAKTGCDTPTSDQQFDERHWSGSCWTLDNLCCSLYRIQIQVAGLDRKYRLHNFPWTQKHTLIGHTAWRTLLFFHQHAVSKGKRNR